VCGYLSVYARESARVWVYGTLLRISWGFGGFQLVGSIK